MNLLTDDWIPVQHQGVFKHISLKMLLCHDEPWQISLPRDDMELACLQLLISLTQVLFVPRDGSELKARIKQPLYEQEYLDAIEGKVDWFDLDHPLYPFMQYKGVDAKTINPMMKLFAGFTESTSGSFVNEPGLADLVCPSCAVIGLFNQANSCASFCGGAKGSIRGNEKEGELKSGIPITTIMSGKDLKMTIWLNVLTQESINEFICLDEECNELPNWVNVVPITGISKNKIKQGEDVYLNKLGMMRGLFWQPQHIELLKSKNGGFCDCCGLFSKILYDGFLFEKFSYKYRSFWRHPHSPVKWELSKGEKKLGYQSFTSNVPVWTHLTGLLIERDGGKEGSSPAVIISQYRKYFYDADESGLLVGGYWTKPGKASINERLHELFSFSSDVDNNSERIERIVSEGLAFKSMLNDQLYIIAKEISKSSNIPKPLKRMVGGIQAKAVRLFFSETKILVHNMLEAGDFKENKIAFENYRKQLCEVTRTIFIQVTEPYQNEPKMIKALAIARRGLEKSLAALH